MSNVLILAINKEVQTTLCEFISEICHQTPFLQEKQLLDVEVVAHQIREHAINTVLLEISLSEERRSFLTGIKLAQKLRKDYKFRGFFVFLGFLPLDQITQQFSLLGNNVLGGDYVQLPGGAARVCEALKHVTMLTMTELNNVVLNHCGVKEEVRFMLHEITNSLTRALGRKSEAGLITHLQFNEVEILCDKLTQLHDYLYHYNLTVVASIVDRMLELISEPTILSKNEVTALLESIERIEELLMTHASAPPTTPSDIQAIAPHGYNTVLVADDNGYPLECVLYLEGRGYVVDVVTSYEEAALTLSADPSAVFLCDQTFGDDSGTGRRLMTLARQQSAIRLIVALSGSFLEPNDVPEAHEICAGAFAKTEKGAEFLHRMICQWAKNG